MKCYCTVASRIKYSVSIDEDSNLARAKFDSWKGGGGVCVQSAEIKVSSGNVPSAKRLFMRQRKLI